MALIAILVFVAVMFIIALLLPNANGRRGFNQRFPPIDDEEFIRRCSPGVSRHVALGVRRIMAEQLGVEYSRVYPEQRFTEDLDC